MNIKIDNLDSSEKLKFPKLFESEQKPQLEKQQSTPEDKELEKILGSKTNQFEFECGIFMATIPSKLEMKFGLLWHVKNTKSFDEFVTSIETFLSNTENVLTENDVKKLNNHYHQYID